MEDQYSVKTLRIWCLISAFFWMVIVLLFATLNFFNEKQHSMEIGRVIGRSALIKDKVYRSWNADKGGVYAPITQDTPPNPYLSHLVERDLTTPSGRRLTLINPAYMTRQVHEMGRESYGLRAHITSLTPINVKNRADDWEKMALQKLATGEKEFSELIKIEGEQFVRVMVPLVTKQFCLKCHAVHGFKLGDQRGGLSVSVPMETIFSDNYAGAIKQSTYFLLAFFVGLGGILFFYFMVKNQLIKRVDAENKANAFQEQWYSTFDDIESIVTIQDNDHRIKKINRAGCKILGITKEEAIGQYCYQLIGDSDKPCHDCQIQWALGDCTPYSAEIRHKSLGKTFLVSATPFTSQFGEEKGVIHYAKDITADKKLQKQLRQAQKMEAIGTLAGGIAHDFNNLLMAMLGYADILKSDLPEGSKNRSYIEQVLKAGNKAKELVKQILTFSRQTEHEKRPLKLHLIVKEAIKLIRASIPTTIEIKQDIDPDSSAILADPSQMHQVIMNLCTNGYQAMRETTGILSISLNAVTVGSDKPELTPGQYLKLEVDDTGHGMEREVMDRIFEPYFTTKKQEEGTGFGLSVVHGIVQDHNGHIQVASEPGKGTVFSVFFPCLADASISPTDEPVGIIPGGEERLLVVDDDSTIAEMLEQMLSSLGYQVTIRTSSIDALVAFKNNPDDFDLIITDMAMPNLNGRALSIKLIAIRPDIPIILCTGFSELIDEKQAKTMGIRRLVMKPIIKRDIGRLIRDVLDEKKGEKQEL